MGRYIAEKGGFAIIRNGDTEPYKALWKLLFKPNSVFSRIVRENADLTFPRAESLTERAELLKFQIQTVAALYRFSKEGKGIGDPTTTLTISSEGIITQSTSAYV